MVIDISRRRRFPSVSRHGAPTDEDYFAIIHRQFEALPIRLYAELWCEPAAHCAPNIPR